MERDPAPVPQCLVVQLVRRLPAFKGELLENRILQRHRRGNSGQPGLPSPPFFQVKAAQRLSCAFALLRFPLDQVGDQFHTGRILQPYRTSDPFLQDLGVSQFAESLKESSALLFHFSPVLERVEGHVDIGNGETSAQGNTQVMDGVRIKILLHPAEFNLRAFHPGR